MLKNIIFLTAVFLGLSFAGFLKFPLILKYGNTLVFTDQSFTKYADTENIKLNKRLSTKYFTRPVLEEPRRLYSMDFKKKFSRVFEEGHGNCANTVSALAWYLIDPNDSIDYNIISILPTEKFLLGHGHTVFDYNGVYDIFERGVFIDHSGQILQTADLLSNGLSKVQFKNLGANNLTNPNDNSYNPFLGMNIGITTEASYARYIDFISIIYIPFLGGKIEKYFYEGIALFFGLTPKIYVNEVYSDLYGDWWYMFYFAKYWLNFVRFLTVLMIIGIVFALAKTYSRD